jgi:hypothetical protein
MQVPRRHHFIPQMLLRNFIDSEGYLHFCDKNSKERKIVRADTGKAFVKNDFYTLFSETGAKDVSTEKMLADLEGSSATIIKKIMVSVRDGSGITLDDTEQAGLATFFLMQWSRTPETQQAATSDEAGIKMLDEILADARKRFPNQIKKIESLAKPEEKARQLRNIRVNRLKDLSPKAMKIITERGFAVLRIINPQKSFIIGSRPVARIEVDGEKHLSNPKVEMWLPIASDIAIGLGKYEGQIRSYILEENKPIRELNMTIARQSRFLASRSPQLLKSILNASPKT